MLCHITDEFVDEEDRGPTCADLESAGDYNEEEGEE
jgi:hypothetical protein